MFAVLSLVLAVLAVPFKSKRRVPSENVIRKSPHTKPGSILAFKFPVPSQKFPVPVSREFCSKSAESLDEWRPLSRYGTSKIWYRPLLMTLAVTRSQILDDVSNFIQTRMRDRLRLTTTGRFPTIPV
jgi:hypothetical protein